MFHVYLVTIISYEYQNAKLHVFKIQLADFFKRTHKLLFLEKNFAGLQYQFLQLTIRESVFFPVTTSIEQFRSFVEKIVIRIEEDKCFFQVAQTTVS